MCFLAAACRAAFIPFVLWHRVSVALQTEACTWPFCRCRCCSCCSCCYMRSSPASAGCLSTDGGLYLATPVDPLLLALPLLERARAQQNVFQDLEQILRCVGAGRDEKGVALCLSCMDGSQCFSHQMEQILRCGHCAGRDADGVHGWKLWLQPPAAALVGWARHDWAWRCTAVPSASVPSKLIFTAPGWLAHLPQHGGLAIGAPAGAAAGAGGPAGLLV